ncbi:hypothetical protein CEXT_729151 [Caerostris extrusa]|uniref:Uncharacterized protein n=1 Tax=Caerostris extrusa TaxID=172846 RepID=A0AAV4PI72_CAEEX|nr:hypothetical protein CEXT_729151 [Caerostris extrusa]
MLDSSFVTETRSMKEPSISVMHLQVILSQRLLLTPSITLRIPWVPLQCRGTRSRKYRDLWILESMDSLLARILWISWLSMGLVLVVRDLSRAVFIDLKLKLEFQTRMWVSRACLYSDFYLLIVVEKADVESVMFLQFYPQECLPISKQSSNKGYLRGGRNRQYLPFRLDIRNDTFRTMMMLL